MTFVDEMKTLKTTGRSVTDEKLTAVSKRLLEKTKADIKEALRAYRNGNADCVTESNGTTTVTVKESLYKTVLEMEDTFDEEFIDHAKTKFIQKSYDIEEVGLVFKKKKPVWYMGFNEDAIRTLELFKELAKEDSINVKPYMYHIYQKASGEVAYETADFLSGTKCFVDDTSENECHCVYFECTLTLDV